MVGVYPTLVLQAGAFLAGAFFVLQPLFIKTAFPVDNRQNIGHPIGKKEDFIYIYIYIYIYI